MGYIQKNNPFPVTSCGRRRTYMQDGGKPKKVKMNKEEKMTFNEKNSSLNQAIINEIERKNNLKKVESSPLKKSCPAGEVEASTPSMIKSGQMRKIKTKKSKGCKPPLGKRIWKGVKTAAAIGLAAATVGAIVKGNKKKK
tara:strand:- start:2751 stop:3170 length:420 start_codon:yes stop_codon:yes gene_type:complete